MELLSLKKECMKDYGKVCSCDVYTAHVKVKNIKRRAEDMIKIISDTGWLETLGVVEKATFRARSKRTVSKLVDEILTGVNDAVTADFGEFMVSETAQSILNRHLSHTKVPLAELLKEKVIGNPGFDFHTESSSKFIAFGEAKYSGTVNPHYKATSQIVDFIVLEKDISELSDLKYFVSKQAVKNALEGKKAYVAAFSINSENPAKILINALKTDAIDSLLNYPELYLIGVEVDA